jgi:hypothetical protein
MVTDDHHGLAHPAGAREIVRQPAELLLAQLAAEVVDGRCAQVQVQGIDEERVAVPARGAAVVGIERDEVQVAIVPCVVRRTERPPPVRQSVATQVGEQEFLDVAVYTLEQGEGAWPVEGRLEQRVTGGQPGCDPQGRSGELHPVGGIAVVVAGNHERRDGRLLPEPPGFVVFSRIVQAEQEVPGVDDEVGIQERQLGQLLAGHGAVVVRLAPVRPVAGAAIRIVDLPRRIPELMVGNHREAVLGRRDAGDANRVRLRVAERATLHHEIVGLAWRPGGHPDVQPGQPERSVALGREHLEHEGGTVRARCDARPPVPRCDAARFAAHQHVQLAPVADQGGQAQGGIDDGAHPGRDGLGLPRIAVGIERVRQRRKRSGARVDGHAGQQQEQDAHRTTKHPTDSRAPNGLAGQ